MGTVTRLDGRQRLLTCPQCKAAFVATPPAFIEVAPVQNFSPVALVCEYTCKCSQALHVTFHIRAPERTATVVQLRPKE